jgi:hypothetical protein
MASVSDDSEDSEDYTPITKRKKFTDAEAENDDLSFKNVLRPPGSTTYTVQTLYGASGPVQPPISLILGLDQIFEGVIDVDPHYQRSV